ncbi:MAG: leucine-rich repeat protein [Lachnospiraceae bacterium]|nr:leucine-rich repeat protein [Lachnospiraceae bacterium]
MQKGKMRSHSLSAIISAMVMLMSVLSYNVPVYAKGETIYDTPSGRLFFEKATGTITWADESVTDVVIPSEIDGVKVTAIKEWAFYNHSNLRSVVIPETVTTIDKGAFFGCTALPSISFPKGLTKIEEQMCYGCTSLTSVTIPNGVTEIGRQAFCGCIALPGITFPKSVVSIGDRAFYRCSSLYDIRFEGNRNNISLADAFDTWFYNGGDFSASYKKGKYYKNLMKVKLTTNVPNNIINIAKSQKGYHEGRSNNDLSGKSKSKKNYTEYGFYYGTNPELWCGDFAEWCVEMGGVPRSLLNEGYVNKFTLADTVYAGKGGTKKISKGDLCHVVKPDGAHMFIVESVKKSGKTLKIKFCDGGHNDSVYADTYKLDISTGKGKGNYSRWTMDYIVSPDYSKLVYHTLKFNANGGKVKVSSRKIAEGALYSVLPTPTKSGKKFVGWFTEKTGGVQVTSYMPFGKTGNQTLYAHWKKK